MSEGQQAECPADRLRRERPTEWVRAQVVPFAVFMVLLLVLQLFGSFLLDESPSAPWWRRAPEHWIYALQTLACLGYIGWRWKYYEFRWSARWSAVGALFGVVGIAAWVLPTMMYDRLGLAEDPQGLLKWLGVAGRFDGFDPAADFGAGTPAFWAATVSRFVRAVVTVALVEEIFWRSFVMRLGLDWDGDYWKQPFGKPSWLTYAAVTGLFVIVHQPGDYAAAVVYGSLTYGLCIWSRNLGACVVMHAVANLLMGLYAMLSGHHGLW